MRFEHIGIFVQSLEKGHFHLSECFQIVDFTDPVDDYALKVRVQFCTDSSGIRYELVSPLGEENPVSGILKSGKNVLNHVAYRVENIELEIQRLRENGCLPFGEPTPALAFSGRRVVFLLTPLRFIIELVEEA